MYKNQVKTLLLVEIESILSAFPFYWENEKLLRSKLIEDIRSYEKNIIEALLSSELIRDTFSIQLDSGIIFKTEDFINMLRYKNYWDNSYTKYSNEIGLTSEGKYLKYNSDVILDFPHKDGVLEGGMTTEDIGKKEIYYNHILAKEEIDVLLAPKVFANIKKYNQDGEQEVSEFEKSNNLIIKGNNLVGLSTILTKYKNSIKGIFIDPPYYFSKKKSVDAFKYNSNFKLSSWLTFLKNRLEMAKELLSDDGIIAVTIGVDGYAHLKLLLDEIFDVYSQPNNYIGTITWRKTDNQSNIGDFANVIDYILLYRKNPKAKLNRLPLTEKAINEYSYEDEKGKYRRSNILDLTRGRHSYGIKTPEGTVLNGPWMIDEKEYKNLKKNKAIHWPQKGKQIPYGKIYLESALENGQITSDFWDASFGTNQRSADEIKNLFGNRVFDFAKPERLMMNIISLISKPGDKVLDFFMGTGTFPAVAMKMNRQFIGIEQMDYINTVSVPRLQKVIEGEQGGVSKELEWQGGGSFIYAELYDLNESYLKKIQSANDENALDNILDKMKQDSFLNFKLNLERVTSLDEDYQNLSIEEKKEILMHSLDMNQLYLSYSEMDDEQYDIPISIKRFNHSFYQNEGEEK